MSLTLVSGAIAGAVSTIVFSIVHAVMISAIWTMLIPMLVAGSLSGLALAWSFVQLEHAPTLGRWCRYNALYLVLLAGLGPVSLLVFEPRITIPELVASSGGLPDDLVCAVLPLVGLYAVGMAIAFLVWYRQAWSRVMVVLPTIVVLMLFLGLNIAALGLVYLTGGWEVMLVELLALVLSLDLVFAGVFWLMARASFSNAQ